MQSTLTLNDSIDGEPRVLDLDIAKRLDFKRPRAVRQLIERNAAELLTYGPNATRRGAYKGQPTTEYYLNEGQALLICTLSRTPKAAEVRHALIDIYTAWRKSTVSAARHVLADDVESLARVVRSPVWAIWRRMCAENHVANPAAMTGEEVQACRAWLRVGGNYRTVPVSIWRQRWASSDVVQDATRLATRWGLSASYVFKRIEADVPMTGGYPATTDEQEKAAAWLAGWEGGQAGRERGRAAIAHLSRA